MTNEQLKGYDFILLLDKSGSMGTKDCPGGKSRWEYAQETTVALARKCCEFDADGITVIPFASHFKEYVNIQGGDEKTAQIFKENEPAGSTDTAKVLQHVLHTYFAKKGQSDSKPIIVLCVTDGEPNDQNAVVNTIIDATKKMDTDEEIGISFVQIGNDPGATRFLKMLDDGLVEKGAKFDIVDTKTTDEIEDMPLADVLIQALTD